MTTTYELYTNENGTPKAVEGKAPAILERVETLETSVETLEADVEAIEADVEAIEETLGNGVVTSVNSQTGDVTVDVGVTSVNGNTGDITPEQTGCLPLGGGKMTGKITSSSERVLDSTNANGLFIVADASITSSKTGTISVFPVNHSQANRAGGFQCVASDGTSNKTLTGSYANGLKWDGKNVVCSVNGTNADSSGNVAISVSPSNSSLSFETKLTQSYTITKGATFDQVKTCTVTGLVIGKPAYITVDIGIAKSNVAMCSASIAYYSGVSNYSASYSETSSGNDSFRFYGDKYSGTKYAMERGCSVFIPTATSVTLMIDLYGSSANTTNIPLTLKVYQ